VSDATRRVATGAGWVYAYRWGERLLDLLSIVVLARLLSPEDFGLVAIAASIVAIVQGLSDFDVDKALIRSSDERRDLFDTAWTLSTLRGLLAALLMAAIAAVLPDRRVSLVLFALAATPLLKGLSNPRFVLFERGLVFSRLAGQTLAAKLVSVAAALAVAYSTRSHWALVVGILAGSLTSLALSYLLRPYRPRWSWSRGSEIFAFSGWMSATTFVTALSMETDKIIVGRLLGVAEAGLYFMTQRIGVLPTRELISPLQRILYPSFSEIAADRERLRRIVAESVNVFASLGLPAGFGFALVANDVVPLLLGDDWLAIVPLLIVLVPFLGLRGILSMTLPAVMALGETRLLFRVSAIYALVHIPAFIAGTAAYALPGAIGSIVVAGLFYIYLSAWMLRRLVGITAGEIARRIRRPIVATAAMVAAVLGLAAVAPFDLFAADGSWVALASKIAVGAAVYCSALYALWRLAGRPSGLERRLLQLRSR
jgi:PST family polysaccharide transporter